MDYETAMKKYMQYRREVELIEAQTAPIKDKMKLILQWMDLKGKEDGLKRIPVKGVGTGFWKTRLSASIANPEEFRSFVIKNEAWDLFENRASATAVKSYIDGHKAPVPGVNLSQTEVFEVRAANQSDKE